MPHHQLAFLHRGTTLEVVNARNNERVATWTFRSTASVARSDSAGGNTAAAGEGDFAPTEITSVAEIVGPARRRVNGDDYYNGSTSAAAQNMSAAASAAVSLGGGRRSLVVGLSSGLVCLLDLKSSKVVRAIQVGKRVTSVAVVSSYGGPLSNHRTLAEELMFFYGTVAVGTSEVLLHFCGPSFKFKCLMGP